MGLCLLQSLGDNERTMEWGHEAALPLVGRPWWSDGPGVAPLGPPSLVSAGITANGVIWGATSPSSIESGEIGVLDVCGTLERTTASLVLWGFDLSALGMMGW